MSKKKLYWTEFVLLLLYSLTPLRASALQDNFTQQILPLNCIFTILNNGTKQIIYITPQACGMPVQSKQLVPGSKSQASSHLSLVVSRPAHFVISPYDDLENVSGVNYAAPVNSTNSAAPLPIPTLPLLKFPLNLSPLANQNIIQSFSITMPLNEVYTFPVISYAANSSEATTSYRTLTISSITDSNKDPSAHLIVSTQSGDISLELRLGQTALLELSHNNSINVGITLNNLNSRLASLTIWQIQPSNNLAALSRIPSTNATNLILVLSGILSVALIWLVQKRIKIKAK